MSVGILGQHNSVSATTTMVYETPVSKKAEISIIVMNTGVDTKSVTLYITKDASPATKDIIQYETISTTSVGFERTALILEAGDKVFYTGTASGIAVTVVGIESDLGTNVISICPPVINSNTTTDIFVPSVASIVNLTASITSGVVTDSATLLVYLTHQVNPVGVMIHKETLTTNSTGFERTGIVVSSDWKIKIVSTNVSGNIATHIHGYKVV